MRNLIAYIDRRNAYAKFFNREMFSLNPKELSRKEIQELRLSLECDLSPENLCCDGELRGSALAKKAKMLNGAYAELERL